MKISAINLKEENVNNIKTPSFKGLERTPDDVYKFYAPPFDREKYDILLEVCPVVEDGNGGFKIDKDFCNPITINNSYHDFKLKNSTDYPRNTVISDPKFSEYMGYRFRLVDKEDAKQAYKNLDPENKKNVFGEIKTKAYINNDPGSKFKDDEFGEFTVISNRMGVTPKAGSAYHVFYDSYTSNGIDRNKYNRIHFNKAGGDIDGILYKKDKKLAPYRYVMTNPYIGADTKSSHKYWSENTLRVPSQAKFKKVLTELFRDGKGYIADGAFTSHSLQSPFFQDVLKNGKKSPYYNWFKIKSGDRIKVGVFPDYIPSENPQHANAWDHIGFKIINPRGVKGYDSNKPSYIQFFDDRLASKEQQNDTKNLIERYDIPNPKDHYDITLHEDSVQPYFFELDYSDKSVRDRFSGYTNKMLTDKHKELAKEFGDKHSRIIDNIHTFFSFENYDIVEKGRAGGVDYWAGSVDLVKLNLSNPNARPENVQGYYDARQYLYDTGLRWTKFAHDAYVENIALEYAKNNPEGRKNIAEIAYKNDVTPEKLQEMYEDAKSIEFDKNLTNVNAKDVIQDIIKNTNFRYGGLDLSPQLQVVLNTPVFNNYMKTPQTTELLANFIIGTLAKMQDESGEKIIEFLPDSFDVLTSEEGKASLDENKEGKSTETLNKQNVYGNPKFAKLTPYGEAVLELLMPNILSYVVTKAIYPNEIITFDSENDAIVNSDSLKKASLAEAGVYTSGDTNTDAKDLYRNIIFNLENKKLTQEKEKEFASLLKDTSINKMSYAGIQFAKEFIKQARAGLNWRFDAAKDIADLNANANGLRRMEDSIDDMIEFWGTFIKNARDVNPSAYVILELTDLWSYFNDNPAYYYEARNELGPNATNEQIEARVKEIKEMDWGKYINPDIAERMIDEKTGATTGSQYSLFFNMLSQFFSKSFESGNKTHYFADLNSVRDGLEKFIQSGPALSVLFTHKFWDNHDKPLGLSCLAVDMGAYLSRFGINTHNSQITQDDVQTAKRAAQVVIGKNPNDPTSSYDNLSSKAMVIGEMYKNAFTSILKDDKQTLDIINKAISDLAQGKFLGKEEVDFFRAEAFGQTSFDVSTRDILKQARYIANKENIDWLDKNEEKELSKKVLETVLEPAMQKLSKMTDFTCAMPGTPFFFAGFDMGSTGYEYLTKNITQQNRNLVRHEWVDPSSSEFIPKIKEYNDRLNASCSLYKEYGLSAMSEGTPIILPQNDSKNLLAMLKYDKNGSNVIQVISNMGIEESSPCELSKPKSVIIPSVKIADKNGIEYKIKDAKGNNAELHRKVYDKSKAKFVDETDSNGNPVKYVVVNGELRRADGKSIVLNDNVTTFCKPLMNDGQKQLDIMKRYHIAG